MVYCAFYLIFTVFRKEKDILILFCFTPHTYYYIIMIVINRERKLVRFEIVDTKNPHKILYLTGKNMSSYLHLIPWTVTLD